MFNFPLNLITFPLWWYTVGVSVMWQWSKRHFHFALQKTGLVLFAHHLGEPLYKDYTRSGRILSFFLRMIMLVWKTGVLIVKSLLLLTVDIAYLALLPAVCALIIFQLLPGK